jgi:hypothetical protein
MPEDRLLVIPAERLTFTPYSGRKVLVNIDFPSVIGLDLLRGCISQWNLRPLKPGQLRERYFVRPTRLKHHRARLHHFTVSAAGSPPSSWPCPQYQSDDPDQQARADEA